MSGSGGLGLGTVLFVVFLVLKLTGNIDWPWIWVFAPLWIGFILFLISVLVFWFTASRIKKSFNSRDPWFR
jgi:energy-coupling factor transporter transmembrane protein EcfT